MPRSKVVSGLTDKERKFCELYASGKDGTEAFRKVYNSKSEDSKVEAMVKRLLNREDIQQELAIHNEKVVKEKMVAEAKNEEGVEKDDEVEVVAETNIKWSQSVAFNRLKKLLDSCDSAMQLLKDRPKLFGEVRDLIGDVKQMINSNNMTSRNTEGLGDLLDCMENIEDIVYKLSKFNIKEYNSTINTANGLMKEINALTGIKKSSQAIKNETFEDKVYRLISGAGNGKDIAKELEEYAFSE